MSRKWLVLVGFALLFIVVVMSSSCTKDNGRIITDSSGILNVKSVSTSPDTADIINDPIWSQAEETGVRIGEDEDYTNALKVGVVKAAPWLTPLISTCVSTGETPRCRFDRATGLIKKHGFSIVFPY